MNKTGLKSAFGYRPYGTAVDLARYTSDSDERWQGKEFDGEHGSCISVRASTTRSSGCGCRRTRRDNLRTRTATVAIR